MGLFKFFTASSLIYMIASYSFHALIKRAFFRSLYIFVHSFSLAFDLWVTWQQQQLTFVALCWSNNAVAQVFNRCAAKTTCPNAIYQTEFDSLYVICKTHYPRWQLSGWQLSRWL